MTTRRLNQNSLLGRASELQREVVIMFLSSWMTYQRRREREKIAAAKIEAKYAVSSSCDPPSFLIMNHRRLVGSLRKRRMR